MTHKFEINNKLSSKVNKEARSENIKLKKEGLRRCCTCKEIQDILSFNSKGKDRIDSICKGCSRLRLAKDRLRVKSNPRVYCDRIIASLRHRSKVENKPFDISGEYLWEILSNQNFLCFYTLEPLDFLLPAKNSTTPHINFPSIDKLDPKLGYVVGNVVWCLWKINRTKSDLTYEEFVGLCKKVAELS